MQRTEPELERKIVRSKEKPGQPTQAEVLTVDWPVVALASSPASDGYWSAQVWARERVPEHQLNATLCNATRRQQRKRLQANAMPLWVIRLSAGLLILAHEKIGPPFSGPKLLEVSTSWHRRHRTTVQ